MSLETPPHRVCAAITHRAGPASAPVTPLRCGPHISDVGRRRRRVCWHRPQATCWPREALLERSIAEPALHLKCSDAAQRFALIDRAHHWCMGLVEQARTVKWSRQIDLNSSAGAGTTNSLHKQSPSSRPAPAWPGLAPAADIGRRWPPRIQPRRPTAGLPAWCSQIFCRRWPPQSRRVGGTPAPPQAAAGR